MKNFKKENNTLHQPVGISLFINNTLDSRIYLILDTFIIKKLCTYKYLNLKNKVAIFLSSPYLQHVIVPIKRELQQCLTNTLYFKVQILTDILNVRSHPRILSSWN